MNGKQNTQTRGVPLALTAVEKRVLHRALISEKEKLEEEQKEWANNSNRVAMEKKQSEINACSVLMVTLGVK